MTRFLEIRNARTFELIDKQRFSKRKYDKLCKLIVNIMESHCKGAIMIRKNKHSFLVQNGKNSVVIGIK